MDVGVEEDRSCYGPGSIALSVILTILVTLLLLYVFYLVWRRWRQKKEKHLVLETDLEKGKNSYAFDNDGFSEQATPHQQTLNSSKVDSIKSKWSQWSPMSAFLAKNEKHQALDDSVLQVDEIQTVLLKSQDFTGLGFNIYGNMRDGIFIKDVLHRGPALESGKLNSGDRIRSVTINFDHIVYEDALTILSYASPYEVIIKSQKGKTNVLQTPSKVPLGHPLYRSSSSSDLIGLHKKGAAPLVYPLEERSPHSSIKLTSSTSTTLEASSPTSANHDSMKSQLEQQMRQNHKYQLHLKEESFDNSPSPKTAKQENKYQKFGIKVLPVNVAEELQQISPKINEVSQNDNNINLEIHSDGLETGNDEVDRSMQTSDVGTLEEQIEEIFSRGGGSGIRRDKNGIPQEIPSHMLNAAISAKRNRKGSVEDVKSPKRQKGRAPAPPENKTDNPSYETDSDVEMDESSVSNIELKPNDITIHQSEEIENMQNRKTASTGDLTKVHRKRKSSTGTLERAQSLDITDAGLPPLNRTHSTDSESDGSLLGKVLADPRLSLTLEGLNTFQRSKLKKSTEWGNLEDAILDLDANKDLEMEERGGVEPIQLQESVTSKPEPLLLTSNTSIVLDQSSSVDTKPSWDGALDFLNAERSGAEWDPYYKPDGSTYGTNVSDDVKVSRHSYSSLNESNSNISNITINSNSETDENSHMETAEFYVTASDQTLINNVTDSQVTIEGPTSLTVQINDTSDISEETPSYVTEIQVMTPSGSEGNKTSDEPLDVEKELHKIQELADEQLKKLPEMRFSTSSYENQKSGQNCSTQIEQLRSNFEKSPSKTSLKLETGVASKSRIPVATIKTPPTSPERRDSRNFDLEIDKDIVAIMSSPIHSTPKYQPKAANRNVSVTSIRSSSKIPSGLPSRPPIPPRKYDVADASLSTNGNSHSTFKQWVFNPGDSAVTNITVSDSKFERK